MPQASIFGSTWQGSLRDLAQIVQQIRRTRIFGRLSLRNSERLSIAHCYFRAGKLVHVVGNRGNAQAILFDIGEWKTASLRFERGLTTIDVTLNEVHERLLDEVIARLQKKGLVVTLQAPTIVESNLAKKREARALITPWEWQVLVEGIRRVSLAVAHVVGAHEALHVLQDVIDDCSSSFPAFASLKIAPTGYLHVVDRSQLDHMSREELLEGFGALIAICQYFCSPIIGEREAHRLILQALHDLAPTLTGLGVFHIDHRLLS